MLSVSSPTPLTRQTAHGFHVMVKPTGPLCNIDCSYCFYTEKTGLYPKAEKWRMSDEVLERFVRQYIEANPADPLTFSWQGGEPTLCGVEFFRKAVAWQKQYGRGRTIENAFQTNGTLLNDEWGQFLAENNFLIGVSIDGPREIHDTYRVDRQGRGTWDKVMRGIQVLQKHKVEFNTLTCVHRGNARHGELVYRFLKGIGSRYLQFIPIVERSGGEVSAAHGLKLALPPSLRDLPQDDFPVTPWSIRPQEYGAFLTAIFDRWVRHDVGRIYVQLFDAALGKWLNMPGGLCIYAETCGDAMALEHDGQLYACDHFVYPEFARGRVDEQPLADLVESPAQKAFGADKSRSLPKYCLECPVRFACNGGCPKHRFLKTPDGEAGLNYLCAGYRQIFTHMDPYLRVMGDLYRHQQPPALIMRLLAEKRIPGLS